MNSSSVVYIKVFSEIADRLDFNFYDPKFEKFIDLRKRTRFKVYGLGDERILKFIIGGTTPKQIPTEDIPEEDKVLFLKNENIKEGRLDLTNRYYIFKKDYEKKLRKAQVEKGDILLSMTGTLGNACLIDEKVKAAINQNVVIIRFNNNLVDNEFILRYLNSEFIKKQIEFLFTSAQTPYLNIGKIKELQLILPDLEVQRKILTKIKEEENLIKNIKDRLNIKSQEMNKSIMDELGVKLIEGKRYNYFYTDFSELESRMDFIWYDPKYKSLLKSLNSNRFNKRFEEYIIDTVNGIEVRDFVKNGTYYIRVGDVRYGRMNITEDTVKIDIKLQEIKKDIKLQDNDIILTRSGRVGSTAIVDSESKLAIISSDIIRVTLKSGLNPKYAVYYLDSLLGKMQFEMIVHGAASPKINHENIKNIIIIVPNLSIQENIVSKIDKVVETIKSLEKEEVNLKNKTKEIMIKSLSE